MARKKETDYFEAFVGGVNSACAAADMLCTVFDHYEPEALPGHIEAMHKIEHSADIAKHGTMEQLVREFLPPIDREDIMELSGTAAAVYVQYPHAAARGAGFCTGHRRLLRRAQDHDGGVSQFPQIQDHPHPDR